MKYRLLTLSLLTLTLTSCGGGGGNTRSENSLSRETFYSSVRADANINNTYGDFDYDDVYDVITTQNGIISYNSYHIMDNRSYVDNTEANLDKDDLLLTEDGFLNADYTKDYLLNLNGSTYTVAYGNTQNNKNAIIIITSKDIPIEGETLDQFYNGFDNNLRSALEQKLMPPGAVANEVIAAEYPKSLVSDLYKSPFTSIKEWEDSYPSYRGCTTMPSTTIAKQTVYLMDCSGEYPVADEQPVIYAAVLKDDFVYVGSYEMAGQFTVDYDDPLLNKIAFDALKKAILDYYK